MTSPEEVQAYAIQQAMAPYGLAQQFGGGKMTRGMKMVMREAEKRGLIIQAQEDLTRQVIQAVQVLTLEIAHAHARTLLSFEEIERAVMGSSYAADIVRFNGRLKQQFQEQLLTILAGSTRVLYQPLSPIVIEEKERNWLQRLLQWDG
jgi:hypothetical protein